MSYRISVQPNQLGNKAVSRLFTRGRRSACKPRSMAGAVASPEQLLKVYDYDDLSESDTTELIQRPRIDFSAILDTVAPIISDVQDRGDAAVREFTSKFDKVDLEAVCVPIEDIPKPSLDSSIGAAFDTAYKNIYTFHEAQASGEVNIETMSGVACRQVRRPIEAVGVYVPGGTAVLPSSVLMLATPAQLAGCKTVVMATPPFKGADGIPGAGEGGPLVPPEVAYCAKISGVTHVLVAGGAQAVAAMAWGTESCPKVDKLFGPGNQFVTAAKMALQSSEAMVAIDMPAGPSEVLVIADANAPPSHVAADLLSQAEHGPDSQVVLVTLPGADVAAIEAQVNEQLSTLPRADAARTALSHSFTVRAPSRDAACAFSNRYAPEHLIINTADAEEWLPQIDHAGSVFLGRWTPESVGDYASGTNHVLPTYGYARMYSGVNSDAFSKKMTVQTLSEKGIRGLGPVVERMAEVEGLEAHKRAVSLRLDDLGRFPEGESE